MDGHAGNNLQFFSSFAQAKQIRLGEPPSALLRSNRYDIGSPLFSVELELGQAKLAGGEVKHGDEVGGGAVAPGFAFGGAEDTV